MGNSLVAQWLRTQHFHCCDLGSIPGQGTKALHSDPASYVVQPKK